METEKVEKWLKDNSEATGLKEFHIEDLRQGESNHNFIINSEGKKYVFRISREISRRNRLKNEYKSLKLLKKAGMANVPEQIFFSPDTQFGAVLIESFVGDSDLDRAGELESLQIKKLSQLMSKAHKIKPEDYNQVFSKSKSSERSLKEIYRDEFDTWSRKPYKEYLDIAEDPIEELEHYFNKQKKLVNSFEDEKVDQRFIHSDLGFNIRASDDEVFIVDWEYGTVGYPGHDIMILFEHGKFTEIQREEFLAEYRKHRDLGDKFEKVRKLHPGFLAFHDAVWAAKRVEREVEREDRRKMLERKMEKLETFYKNRT
jgi:aminoglycoside phosphotransferase (APT) family kinase protein